MREPIRDKGRLEHILMAIDDATEFAKNISLDDLMTDKIHCYAIAHCIQIIGEATYMLTKEFKAEHPEVEWRLMEGMRHILVHDYYQVKEKELWNVVQKDLPALRPQIEAYLSSMEYGAMLL